jgi:hypothetical protein
MCGYVENKGDRIHLSHLASILRFPVKAKYNNTTLKRVVITSTTGAIIAGAFEVNCKNSTITPTENSGNSIIYSLPINFTLKTDKESIFYISLPAVDMVVVLLSSKMRLAIRWSLIGTLANLFRKALCVNLIR